MFAGGEGLALMVSLFLYWQGVGNDKGLYIPSKIVSLPLILYGAVIALYCLFWMPGIRSSLFYDLWKRVVQRTIIVRVGLALVILYWLFVGLNLYTEHLIVQEKGKRLVAIAVMAASQINPDDLEHLRFARDMKRPEYQRVFKLLNDVRKQNPEIVYVYILRPTETDGIWEFVADADSNYYIPNIKYDYNADKKVDDADENVWPGMQYDLASYSLKINKGGLLKPIFDATDLVDQWGTFITGTAPIRSTSGKSIAIFAVDVER